MIAHFAKTMRARASTNDPAPRQHANRLRSGPAPVCDTAQVFNNTLGKFSRFPSWHHGETGSCDRTIARTSRILLIVKLTARTRAWETSRPWPAAPEAACLLNPFAAHRSRLNVAGWYQPGLESPLQSTSNHCRFLRWRRRSGTSVLHA